MTGVIEFCKMRSLWSVMKSFALINNNELSKYAGFQVSLARSITGDS